VYVFEKSGGPDRTRICDLYRVKVAVRTLPIDFIGCFDRLRGLKTRVRALIAAISQREISVDTAGTFPVFRSLGALAQSPVEGFHRFAYATGYRLHIDISSRGRPRMPHLGLDIFQVATSIVRQSREGAAHDLAVRHPRRAGGLMSWTASKAVGYGVRRRAEARLC